MTPSNGEEGGQKVSMVVLGVWGLQAPQMAVGELTISVSFALLVFLVVMILIRYSFILFSIFLKVAWTVLEVIEPPPIVYGLK